MSLLALSLRRHDEDPVIPPPPAGAMAMPRGAVNGYGTAADFYDSVGVNVQVLNGRQAASTAIAYTSRIGFRHVRDAALPSWSNFWAKGAQGIVFWNALKARNRALPTPGTNDQGHPIFLSAFNDPWGPLTAQAIEAKYQANPLSTAQGLPYRIASGQDYTPAGLKQFFGGGHVHYDGNASPTAQKPYIGSPMSDASSPIANPECPWEIVSALGGPNEPGTGGAGIRTPDNPNGTNPYSPQMSEISAWMGNIKRMKDGVVGVGYGKPGTLSGVSRIVTENGLVTTAPQVKQIPTYGYVVMNPFWVYNTPGAGQSSERDMSKGGLNPVDVGDQHQYQYAEEPCDERMLGQDSAGNIGYTNIAYPYFNGFYDPYNGSQYPTPSNSRGPDPTRALPLFHTEWAMCDQNDAALDGNAFVIGQWPSPKDVNAEYTVRQFLQAYNWGVRRTYYFHLWDENQGLGAEANLGLYSNNGTIKPSGLAIQNLLKLVGFSEPSQAGRRKLTVSISGYPTGQKNTHHYTDGRVAHTNVKKLVNFQIQQDDDNWLLVLVPVVTLWDQAPGNRNAGDTAYQSLGNPTNGRQTVSPSTLTITLPSDVTDAAWAQPTAGLTPNGASYTWTDPTDGLDYNTVSINGSNQITVSIAGNTKLVKLTTGGQVQPTNKPLVVPSAGATAATLRRGTVAGARLHMKSMNVWGVQSPDTNNSFALSQYTNRATIMNVYASWVGASAGAVGCVRLRTLASDYNNAPNAATGGLTKAQIIARITDWKIECASRGIYFMPCDWAPLDPVGSGIVGAGWANRASNAFPMFTDIYNALGPNDPMVLYEPFNEPNGLAYGDGATKTANTWTQNILNTIDHFRTTLGYRGVLVIDPINWANSGTSTSFYSDSIWSNVEAYDAAKLGGPHQIVWAKHDYANEYSGSTWNATSWANAQGGSQIKHLTWETEIGNFNGAGTTNDTWSSNAMSFMAGRFATQQNFVGAAPFLYGPWFDANAITGSDNKATTTWGTTVKNTYFGVATPPPPSTGFQPGIIGGGDSAKGAQALELLNAEVARTIDQDPGQPAAALDGMIGLYAARGIRCLILANFDANPSTATAQNVGTWAARFGPGGTFWQQHPEYDPALAVRHIEWGNEHSMEYRQGEIGGGPYDSPEYAAFAQQYAQRAQTAAQAITSANSQVSLLAQADNGGSGTANWVNNMHLGAPNLGTVVGGWSVHPYGPTYDDKIDKLVSQTGAFWSNTIPIDVTEVGIATDNGPTMYTDQCGVDNYGWKPDSTYAEAASQLQGEVTAIKSGRSWSPRIRYLMVYSSFDLTVPGDKRTCGNTQSRREDFFGGLKNDLSDKGVFSTQIRSIMAS